MVLVAVVRVVRMVPVQQRIVKAHANALGAERLHIFAHQVAAAALDRVIVGQFGIEQAEAVVVLCGQHGVLHTGLFAGVRPLFGVVIDGVELVEVLLIVLDSYLFALTHPFAARGDGI